MLYLHGLGHFHPRNVIDNALLEALHIGTNEQWILERVGRYILVGFDNNVSAGIILFQDALLSEHAYQQFIGVHPGNCSMFFETLYQKKTVITKFSQFL